MSGSQTRLDIRSHRDTASGGEVFYWVVQSTLPVTSRAKGMKDCPSRSAAVADYYETARLLGWSDDVEIVEET